MISCSVQGCTTAVSLHQAEETKKLFGKIFCITHEKDAKKEADAATELLMPAHIKVLKEHGWDIQKGVAAKIIDQSEVTIDLSIYKQKGKAIKIAGYEYQYGLHSLIDAEIKSLYGGIEKVERLPEPAPKQESKADAKPLMPIAENKWSEPKPKEPEVVKEPKGEVRKMSENKELITPEKTNLPDANTKLTTKDIIKYICPNASETEAYVFLQLCLARGLNPFTKEAYLIKYGSQPATMVVGKDTFTRKAEESGKCDGFEAGIIVCTQDKKIERRVGVVQYEGDTLIGGWAKVFRKDMTHPFVCEVPLNEYLKRKQDGTPQSNWATMPGTMIRKVALVQVLREAFTKELGGCYDAVEMGVEAATK